MSETTEPSVSSAPGTALQSASATDTPPARNRLLDLSELVEGLWVIISRSILLALVLLFFYKIALTPPTLVIDDIPGDKGLDVGSYLANTLPARIIHHLDRVSTLSHIDKTRLETHFRETLLDVKISTINVSVETIISYLRSAIGNPDYHIYSYLTHKGNDFSLTVWGVTADGRLLDYTTPPSQNADAMATDAAENIDEVFDPLLLASYRFSDELLQADTSHSGSLSIITKLTTAKSNPPMSPIEATDEDKARAYNLWGLILVDQNKLDEAIEKYRSAVTSANAAEPARYPWPLWKLIAKIHKVNIAELAYANWGDVLERLGRSVEAVEKYREAMLWNKKFENAYTQWATDPPTESQAKDDMDKYRKEIHDTPDDPASYFKLSEVLWSLGKKEEAHHYLQQALALAPDDVNMLIIYSHAMIETGQVDDAENSLLKLSNIDPGNADVWDMLAKLYTQLGLDDKAQDAAEHVIHLLHPEDRPSVQ